MEDCVLPILLLEKICQTGKLVVETRLNSLEGQMEIIWSGRLCRISFPNGEGYSTNILRCLTYCCYLKKMNKTLQHTGIYYKHLQSSNVYAKVTPLLQYTHLWWWPKSG